MMVAHNSQGRGPLSLDSGRIAVLARYLLSDSCILLVECCFSIYKERGSRVLAQVSPGLVSEVNGDRFWLKL